MRGNKSYFVTVTFAPPPENLERDFSFIFSCVNCYIGEFVTT